MTLEDTRSVRVVRKAGSRTVRTATQWGVYDVRVEGDEIAEVLPLSVDPDPSPIGQALVDTTRHATRVARPAIRKGYLEGTDPERRGRGREPFVEVSWDLALDLATG